MSRPVSVSYSSASAPPSSSRSETDALRGVRAWPDVEQHALSSQRLDLEAGADVDDVQDTVQGRDLGLADG